MPTHLTTDKLFIFYNKNRNELRAMPLSKQLCKILLIKQDLPNESIYEITRQLIHAEKTATAKQKSIFKHIDQELNIPYQKAKALEKEGKLSQETFVELLNPSKKVKEKAPSSAPIKQMHKS